MQINLQKQIFPEDIKNLDEKELELLALDIRKFLVKNVSETGGHLASNLGIVELTLALHKVFQCPVDKLVWDVGHQSYVHKILTGRSNDFSGLRQLGGISGFPKRCESIYDTFDSGHSSNSISAALGMAVSRDLKGEQNEVIAVIGDGALTGGPAYEGLNNAGTSKTKLIVILNDNEMSISKNIGGMTLHLNRLRASEKYIRGKKRVKDFVSSVPVVGNRLVSGMSSIRDTIKYILVPGVLFEEMGFTYMGPVDGHNISELIEVLNDAKKMNEPVLVHVITKKGKGYRPAENNPDKFHGVGRFDPATGVVWKGEEGKTYSQLMGDTLGDLAEDNEKIVAISAAMIDGVGLAGFSRRFPHRTFDVGIAEQHAVSFASGLALEGIHPLVAIYSTFLQRAYDQVLLDVCMQKLPVVFAIDRAGIVGADGETHHGVFDLSYLSSMPNLRILAPSCKEDLESMLKYVFSINEPCAIRYPRGIALSAEDQGFLPATEEELLAGKGSILREGTDVSIFAEGRMVETCIKVCEELKKNNIDAELVDPRFIKPLDEDLLLKSARKTGVIVTVEDNMLIGGFGSLISMMLAKHGINDIPLLCLGWPDEFIAHGKPKELEEVWELTPDAITKKVCELLEKRKA